MFRGDSSWCFISHARMWIVRRLKHRQWCYSKVFLIARFFNLFNCDLRRAEELISLYVISMVSCAAECWKVRSADYFAFNATAKKRLRWQVTRVINAFLNETRCIWRCEKAFFSIANLLTSPFAEMISVSFRINGDCEQCLAISKETYRFLGCKECCRTRLLFRG